jgi:hypothetical protein
LSSFGANCAAVAAQIGFASSISDVDGGDGDDSEYGYCEYDDDDDGIHIGAQMLVILPDRVLWWPMAAPPMMATMMLTNSGKIM